MTEEKKNDNCRMQEAMIPIPPDWFLDTFMGFAVLFGAFAICLLAYDLFQVGILHWFIFGAASCWMVGRAIRKWAEHD